MEDWVALADFASEQGLSEHDVWAQIHAGHLLHREAMGRVFVRRRHDRVTTSLAARPATVPMHYAERTMATIIQLHEELMTEKERTIDIHRRLLTREQACAELESYVRLLEAKLEGRFPDMTRPERLATVRPIRPDIAVAHQPPQPREVPRSAACGRPDGWRAW